MSLWRGQRSTIATTPLTGVCLALVLATVPLLDKVAPWAVAIFAAAILLRLMVNRQRLRLPALPLKIVLLALGLGGVAFSYGGLVGVEPGLGVLLILLSLKLLETNTVRDFQVLALLGWFLCLCGLFFSQDLTTWLYLGAVALLLAASLIRFHRAPERGEFASSFWLGLKLLVQALPIIVLLFLFFPRSHGGFRFQFSRSLVGVTGMSDRLSPGSFTSLTQDTRRAFRVDFPDGHVPPLSQLYWRGGVLWRGEGLTWVRGPEQMAQAAPQLEGPATRQRILLDPHSGRWLFALDRPASEVRDATFEAGGFLQSIRPIVAPLRYDVTSRPENRETTLPDQQRSEALRKPMRISPQVQGLVDGWRAMAQNDREVVDAALRHFRKERFTYSLTPNTYGADALTEFLFERRTGFCEHYAAAFASLMRIAGIPSRIVIGYQGGSFNPNGNYVVVEQRDAHAWAEVWLKESGWLRVDPTNIVAPERLSSGFESYLESQAAEGVGAGQGSAGVAGLRDMFREVQLVWDNLKYQWDLRVLNYDEESQQTFFAILGLGDLPPLANVIWLTIGVVLTAGLLGLWLRRPQHHSVDPALVEYERFCRRLAAAGVTREPWEGPKQFAERAALEFPEHAAVIRKVVALYIASRYAPRAAGLGDFRKAVRELPRLSRLPAPAATS
jgi:transglutaminase-like putative cysteine protease